MRELRYTLISDGTSDCAFIPILNWLLRDLGIDYAIQPTWADLSLLPNPAKSLPQRITQALELYPGDLLFIHRDAEKESLQTRLDQIQIAVQESKIDNFPFVCVVPIRMLEAWLLFDELAIKKAAGNPHSNCTIQLPTLNKLESLSDPKLILCELLKAASELKGRRLKKFKERHAIHLLAENINDFSPLYQLSAFQTLKTDLLATLNSRGWL